jgi:hypothetical protein
LWQSGGLPAADKARLANFNEVIASKALKESYARMEWKGLVIEARAFEDNGLVAIHHQWSAMRGLLENRGMMVAREQEVFACKSLTQHIDTMNRLIFVNCHSE